MTATGYAKRVTTDGDVVSWAELEHHAFAGSAAADAVDRSIAEFHGSDTEPVWKSALAGIAVFLISFWPVIGAGLLIVPLRLGDESLGWQSALNGVGSLAFVALRVGAWIQNARRNLDKSPQEAVLMLFTAGFAGISVLLSTGVAIQGWAPLGWVWVVAHVAAVIASVFSFFILRARGRAVNAGAPVDRTPYTEAEAQIRALPTEEQEAVRADLAAALRVLVDAGAITEEDAASYAEVPLGGLTMRIWMKERAATAR